MARHDPPPGLSISPRIADPNEIASRLDAVRAQLTGTSSRAPELPELINLSERVLAAVPIAHPGLRGRLAVQLKLVVRRLIYWYTDPSWRVQHELNTELATLAVGSAEEIARLRALVEQLEIELLRVQSWSVHQQRVAITERRSEATPGTGA